MTPARRSLAALRLELGYRTPDAAEPPARVTTGTATHRRVWVRIAQGPGGGTYEEVPQQKQEEGEES